MERLYAGQQLHRQKLVHAEELFTADQRRKAALAETAAAEKRRADEARAKERECKNAARAAEKIRRQAEQARRKAETERIKAEQAARRQEQRNAMQSVRLMQREHTAAGTLYRSKTPCRHQPYPVFESAVTQEPPRSLRCSMPIWVTA